MWMTEKEKSFLIENLKNDQKLLEWGCGTSTIEFARTVKEVHSIEHNEEWFINIKNELLENKNANLYLCKPDTEYHEGGHCGTYEQFKTYITTPINLGKFDVILIDGRARVECSKICEQVSNNNTLIFVHDYRQRYNNENYKEIENYLSFISEVENLALFKIKK
jgi:protein-L-isoaspartate O-methyltransferase